MLNKLDQTTIVKNTLNNNNNVRKVAQATPVVFLADMDAVVDYYPTAPKLQPLRYDVFEPAYKKEVVQPQPHVSFMKKVVSFFGLNK